MLEADGIDHSTLYRFHGSIHGIYTITGAYQ